MLTKQSIEFGLRRPEPLAINRTYNPKLDIFMTKISNPNF